MSRDEADQMYFLNNKMLRSKNMVKVTLTSNRSIRKFLNFISWYYYIVIFNCDEPTIVMHAWSTLHTSLNKQAKIFSVLHYLLKCFMYNIIQWVINYSLYGHSSSVLSGLWRDQQMNANGEFSPWWIQKLCAYILKMAKKGRTETSNTIREAVCTMEV